MLKFFRRIRRKLVDKGNLKRYLIYAVGEILLVMIGILLALQVNNWNENKKNRAIEAKLLNGILENLNEDNDNLIRTTNRLSTTLENIDRLFDSRPIPDDSLAQIATRAGGLSEFIPITAAYERGMNGGDFSLIRPDSIANLIQRLYSFEYESIKTAKEGLLRKISLLRESGIKYEVLEIRPFSRDDGLYDTKYVLPFNIDNLKKRTKDPEFKSHYAGIYENINALILFYKNLIIKNRALVKNIKQYVKTGEF